ncbi:putative transposase of the Rover3 hAT-like family [Lachancea dasiensis]|uniref:Putative transposase of the Rover3 hAT-like family n=1 Tax=Lachancea dasiensis TaxID=1072105 RepID=A0A1G4K5I4_9SACH|nr:putative transposase of the Rover3 hAT-like family [Lachancea dasiensis]
MSVSVTSSEADIMVPESRHGPDNNIDESRKPVAPRQRTRWMERSSVRDHFQVSESSGIKTASCIYCGRSFSESKSTGNLSKHIRNVHPMQFRSQKAATSKEDSIGRLTKSQSLQLPANIIQECKHSPGAIATIGFLAENFIPVSLVSSATWKWLCKVCPETSLIHSEISINTKLNVYSRWFDDALIANMEHTDYINLVLDNWSGANGRYYLGITASYTPNMLNEKVLSSLGEQALLSNFGDPSNSHLLDLVDIGDQPHTDECLLAAVTDVLERFKIAGKIGSLTSGGAPFKTSRQGELLDRLVKPEILQRANRLYHIRCANCILDAIFRNIVQRLLENEKFKMGLKQVGALAKVMKGSPFLKTALAEAELPMIPSNLGLGWICIWDQLATFLEHRQRYSQWIDNLRNSSKKYHLPSTIDQQIELPIGTIQLLEYFVSCCSIFRTLSNSLQDDAVNNISNAVTFYCTMKKYFELCSIGEAEVIETTSEGSFDFTFINGAPDHSKDVRRPVLEAVLSARQKFDEYFNAFKENEIYFVAAFLDPSLKFDCFSELMVGEEGEQQFKKVELYLKSYLAECQSKNRSVPRIEVPSVAGTKGSRINKLPRPNMRTKHSIVKAYQVLEEWERYKADGELTSETATDAVRWWYSRRRVYPNLFPLAVSMIYTKFSKSRPEGTFSISETFTQKNHLSIESESTKKLIVLRDRFSKFGLFGDELGVSMRNGDGFESLSLSNSGGDLADEEDLLNSLLQHSNDDK